MTNFVKIKRSEYDELMKDHKRLNFMERYRPHLVKDGKEKGIEMVIEEYGIIETVRYGSVRECIDGAAEDIRSNHKILWVGEDTEIYITRSLEELVKAGFFTDTEMAEIQNENLWGIINDSELDRVITYIDVNTKTKIKSTLRQIVASSYDLPALILTNYGD